MSGQRVEVVYRVLLGPSFASGDDLAEMDDAEILECLEEDWSGYCLGGVPDGFTTVTKEVNRTEQPA